MKVYVEDNSPLMNSGQAHTLPFAFDKRWELTSNSLEADIVPLLHFYGKDADEQYEYFKQKFDLDTRVVLLSLFHDSEEEDINRFKTYLKTYNNITILSTSYNKPFKHVKFYDFLWNRTKGLYGFGYLDYNKAKASPWIHRFSKDIFSLDQQEKNIKFNILCPNRAYYGKYQTIKRLNNRKQLHDIVRKNRWHNVLISNPDRGQIFVTDNWKEKYKSVIEQGGTYAPIANKYYEQSFLSAYVESVVEGCPNLVKSITEKTWEPLLKGHFILPYAAPGIIDELKQRGFKFPDFIDYDYASYTDDAKRWEGFLTQFQKIQGLSLDQLNILYEENVHILDHNRALFKTLPYDDLYEKLKTP